MPVEIQGSWLRGTCGVGLQKNIKKWDNFSHFIIHDIGDGSKIASCGKDYSLGEIS